ncbi:polysaccharide deacetylase family protein [Arthrobacter sp. TWP1-1]|uniref:polysaccharide deacetylase family protein n=1 Tax=Arthrobacter sp. TWP1-1 TaxID=2804568 RepID=UPI003CF013EF
MPRHFSPSRHDGRRIGLLILSFVVALVVAGTWWVVSTTSPDAAGDAVVGTAGQSPASTSTDLTATAAATTAPTQAPASLVPSAIPTNPATGRVDTLEGLIPDYVLPPIVDGLAPVLTKVPTEQKVVFLTIDDGAVQRDSDLALLEQSGIKASLFLAHKYIADQPAFYLKYTAAGHLIENHTMTHNLGFIQLSYEEQKAEICSMADFAEQQYGRRPVFFRPPGGPYTQATRQAVAACGLKAIVDWEAKANAGGMDYQVGAGLRPGEIVLMHFRPEFPQDLAAFLKAQEAAGLKVVLLEDYLATA